MSRRPLYLVVPALLACALGYLKLAPSTASALAKTAATSAAVVEEAPREARPSAPRARVTQARYRLVSEHRALVNGVESAKVMVQGAWITTPRTGDRTEVRLSADRITVTGDKAPLPGDVAAPFVMENRDGVLAALAFSDATPGKSRDFLAGLATLLQHSDRPGDTWTVEEEDLAGVYEAQYTRSGDTVTRQRGRYTKMRGPSGLEAREGDALQSSEESRFTFDAKGLVRATVKLAQTSVIAKGMPTVEIRATATLVREDVAEVALEAGARLAPEAITTHVDHAAIARRRQEKLVAGAHASELIADARAAAHLDRKEPGVDRQRNTALRRLSALVQLEGDTAREIGQAIREDANDAESVRLLAGSLASAKSSDATGALASLLDAPLPDESRSIVLANLALARKPTAESAAALTSALDQPMGAQAALALGAEAARLGDDPASNDAVGTLLARYEAATTPAERRLYLEALGNTGSREALPVMLAAIQGGDYALARAGALGLRLIPGDDVDDALAVLIESASPVMFEALEAVGSRSPTLWKPRLVALEERFAGQKRVLEAIEALLTRWGNLSVPAKP